MANKAHIFEMVVPFEDEPSLCILLFSLKLHFSVNGIDPTINMETHIQTVQFVIFSGFPDFETNFTLSNTFIR